MHFHCSSIRVVIHYQISESDVQCTLTCIQVSTHCILIIYSTKISRFVIFFPPHVQIWHVVPMSFRFAASCSSTSGGEMIGSERNNSSSKHYLITNFFLWGEKAQIYVWISITEVYFLCTLNFVSSFAYFYGSTPLPCTSYIILALSISVISRQWCLYNRNHSYGAHRSGSEHQVCKTNLPCGSLH